MATRSQIPTLITGLAVGLEQLTNLVFDKHKPYRACLICGAVYQSDDDRAANVAQAAYKRRLWATKHAKTHSVIEHEMLKLSGNVMTADAANRLAAFGLIPAVDAVRSDEINHALYESSAIPTDDCQS